MKRPLFAAGLTAFLALLLCMTLTITVFTAISAALFAAGMVVCVLRKKRLLRPALALTAVWVTASLLFYAHYLLRVKPSFALYGQTVSVEGRLSAPPEQREGGPVCRLERCRINGKQTAQTVTVYLGAGAAEDAALYDTVRFPKVRMYDAPEASVFFFHTISNDAWLNGRAYTGEVTNRYTGSSPLYLIAKLRHSASRRLRAALPTEQAEIAAALLLGENGALSQRLKSRLRIAGASHIFAVSGMHLALWSAVIFLLLRKSAKTKRWANAGAGGFVLFYIVLTGFSPSVLRAGIMLLTIYIGRMLRLQPDPRNSLGLAALLQLAWNPFLAGNVSFLLSFFATAAILILAPGFSVRVSGKPSLFVRLQRQGAAVVNGVTLSLCVLFFTVPVSALFFGGVSLLSPVSSVVCTLPAQGVMLAGAAGLLLGFFPSAAALCFRLSGFCATLLSRAAQRLAKADFLYLSVNKTHVLLWYALTLILCVVVYYFSHKKKRAVINLLLLSVFFVLIFSGAQRLARRGETRLLLPDAGNATALCLQFDGCVNYMIGAGETRAQTRAALDWLADEGALRMDGLIVPDAFKSESGQMEYVGKTALPRTVFTAVKADKFFPDAEVCRCAENFRLTLPNGTTYTNRCEDTLCAGLLEGGSRVVFSYSPANDFTHADPAFRAGDCLVCREALPQGLDPAAFRLIFVLTDKSGAALDLPPNAKSVHDLGGTIVLL